jgi:anthranilate phosphoribosyltransferase
VPTVFNVLGPLANPARPQAALIGCADSRLVPVLAAVLAGRGTKALVVRGDDGLDELTVFAPSTVWDVTAERPRQVSLDPLELGIERPAPDSLRGDDAELNARVLTEVLGGSTSGRNRAVRDAVLLNAAAALVAWDAATAQGRYGAVSSPLLDRVGAALPAAVAAVDSGRTAEVLSQWVAVSSRLAAGG